MKRSATFARGLFSPLLYQLSYPANPDIKAGYGSPVEGFAFISNTRKQCHKPSRECKP
jgi:hypothetical protein